MNASATSLAKVGPPSAGRAASAEVGTSSVGDAPDPTPPPFPVDIVVPELVGGGFEYEAEGSVGGESERAVQHASADARPAAVLDHRARLQDLASQQRAEACIPDDLVASVRLNLCAGERRRLLLADILVFYELMAYFCKERLDLAQFVYELLVPLTALGVSIKLTVSHVRKAPSVVVPLKRGNQSQMRVPGGLAVIRYILHWKNSLI